MPGTERIDAWLLEKLRCPIDKGGLEQRDDRLVCTGCGAAFPIRDGIAVMRIEEATPPDGVSSVDELLGRQERT